MRDEDQSRDQLLQELAELRRRLAELEERAGIAQQREDSEPRSRPLGEATAAQGVAVYAAGQIVTAGRRLADLLGYEPAELSGLRVAELVAAESADPVRTCLAPGGAELCRAVCLRRDGSRFPAELAVDTIPYLGQTLGLLTVRDITEQVQAEAEQQQSGQRFQLLVAEIEHYITKYKQAERALADSQARLCEVVRSLPLLLYAEDAEGRVIAWSKQCEQVTGYSAAEVLGSSAILRLSQPAAQQLPHPQPAAAGAEGGGDELGGWQTELTSKDGLTRTIAWTRMTEACPIVGWASWTVGVELKGGAPAEAAQGPSEAWYRSVFEEMPDGFAHHRIVLDERGKPVDYVFLNVNDAFLQLTGLARAELIGRRATEVLPGIEEDPVDWIGRYGRVALEGTRVRFESHSEPLGRWHLICAYSPAPEHFVTFFEDITERKLAELALRRSEEKWRSLILNNPDAIMKLDRQGTILFVSRTAPGMTVEETVGQTVYDFIPPAQHEISKRAIAAAYETGQQVDFETPVIVPGGLRLCSNRLIPLEERGAVAGLMQISRDITDKKRAEELYQKVIFGQRDAVLIMNAESPPVIEECNPAVTRTFGYTQDELVGRSPGLLLHASPEKARDFEERLRAGIEKAGFFSQRGLQLKRQDGTLIYCDINVVPLADEHRRIGWVSVIRDVTEQKRMEQRIIASQEELRALASELGRAGELERRRVSAELHDHVGQLLVATKIQAGLLRDSLSCPEHESAANRILELIGDIMRDVSTMSFELCPPILYEVGLVPALQWFVEQLRRRHGIACRIEDDGTDLTELSDELRGLFFQSVRELLRNVLRHARASHVRISIEGSARSLTVTVEDDGVGFEPSRRHQRDRESGGFGLFSIRERFRYIGGSVRIDSAVGQGSRLTLTAPWVRA